MRALSPRLLDPKAVAHSSSSVLKILEGQAEGGKVKTAAERAALVGVLSALSEAPCLKQPSADGDDPVAAKLPGTVSIALLGLYKDEGEGRVCSHPFALSHSCRWVEIGKMPLSVS